MFLDWRFPAELKSPGYLHISSIPAAQVAEYQNFQASLSSVDQSYRTFIAACMLNGTAQSQISLCRDRVMPQDTIWWTWMFMATRQASQSVHDFKNAIDHTYTVARKIADWGDRIDAELVKNVKKRFNAAFSEAEMMRDAAAHPEAHVRQPEKHRTPKGPTMINMLEGTRLTTTFKQRTLSIDLGPATMTLMHGLVTDYYRAFAALEGDCFHAVRS